MQSTPTISSTGTSTRRQVLAGGVLTLGAWVRARPAMAQAADGISHSAEAIHQEPVFKAGRKRVYDALTIAAQFDQVIRISGVMRSAAMSAKQAPTQISVDAGGSFALFGGYIVGRQIELVPDELIVQAWRVGGWRRGVYSIARFELTDNDGGTKIVFDHGAFPSGQAEHLALGWQEHYWSPLATWIATNAKS